MSVLSAQGVRKRFGGLVAVDDMSFEVKGGEILGLIGPNGSGKSTTLSMVMGVVRPDAGSIRLDGTDIAGWPAHRISKQGISIAFQHSRPLHRQTILENIRIALLPDSLLRLVADPHVDKRARAIAHQVGLDDVLDRLPQTLPFAYLRRLELAKAIARDPQVVLLDEPFAGLTATEVQEFSRLILRLRDDGRAVMLIDHNVKGVRALVDRIVAMSAGRKVAEGTPDDVINDPTVREVYLGGSLAGGPRRAAPRPARKPATPLLQVRDLSVRYGKALALDDVTFEVNDGEFVALVGLNGAGKTTLFNAVSGLVPHAGEIHWQGQPLGRKPAAAIARAGIVHCPETRELFGDLSVYENLELGGHRLDRQTLSQQLDWLYGLFPILKDRHRQTARTLSGGEQQMLAIARALIMQPRLLILDEPTLGLAPIVIEEISRAMDVLRRDSQLTVLLGEQNVTFALRHAERVYVIEHGQIIWTGTPETFTDEISERYL